MVRLLNGSRALIFSSFPALLACGAFTCSALFTFFCESVQLQSNDASLPNIEFGLYTTKRYYAQEAENGFTVKSGCFYFDEDVSFDSKWKTARAFACMTIIVGGIAFIVSIFAPMCWGLDERAWRALAGLFIVILPFLQGMTFLMLRSETCSGDSRIFDFMDGSYSGCEWNGGSTANVCGIVMWVLAGAVMLFSGAPVSANRQPAVTQDVAPDAIKGSSDADSADMEKQ